jgi:hypothetical protein
MTPADLDALIERQPWFPPADERTEWANQAAAELARLRDENARLRAGEEKLRYLLIELVAQVRGECPSLLDEDSGGDARLSIAIDDAIIEGKK